MKVSYVVLCLVLTGLTLTRGIVPFICRRFVIIHNMVHDVDMTVGYVEISLTLCKHVVVCYNFCCVIYIICS